ncbi:MAG: 23S rRNA (adenine(2503)-C(2))-methyltransferase RlmN [Spirochaetes bacterium]|nr:23S rRNA (adenine(2503)-C(2))-methyltransferase RlmN [Spirochaetota bacterium]
MQNKLYGGQVSPSQIKNYFLDPTNYTFSDFSDAFGFEIARAVYNSLFKTDRTKPVNRQIVPVDRKCDKNTTKYVFQLFDKRHIETVVIRRRTGKTICISTQVGCSVKCKFCKSGENGLIRNLSASEIVQQYLFVNDDINRIVFMGIGEPLLNYEQLIKSIHILRDRNGLDFPTDGISISTVGPCEKLMRLRDEHIKIQLVLSLHATDQQTRDFLIPGMVHYSINEVIALAMEYGRRHKRKISIAYLLLPDINNRRTDADKLIQWFSNKNAVINLLKYNGDNVSTFKQATQKELEKFKNKLKSGNVQVTIRQSLGDTIEAACGQLAIR